MTTSHIEYADSDFSQPIALRPDDRAAAPMVDGLRDALELARDLQDDLEEGSLSQALRSLEHLRPRLILLEATQNYPGPWVKETVAALERAIEAGRKDEINRHKKLLGRMIGVWRADQISEYVATTDQSLAGGR